MEPTKKKLSHRERIIRQARLSIEKGRCIVPIPPRSKAPALKNWPVLRLTVDQLEQHFGLEDNLGWLTGEASGDLVDVDLDSREAVLLGKAFLPPTERIHGRNGRPSSHYWYRVSPAPQPIKYAAPDGKCLVEIRSTGQQTLIPPSIHPNGKRLKWEAIGEPAEVDANILADAVLKVALGALLARHWPGQGQRHDAANALAGMLLRAGWNEADVSIFVEKVAQVAADEEADNRAQCAITTARRLRDGGTITGLPTLATIMGGEVASRASKLLRIDRQPIRSAISIEPADWPDPATLGDELPAVQAFTLDLLPESFRPLVEDISERMQTPLDYAGAAAVVALAGCVNRRATIQPKALDGSWLVVPNLWGAIVAPPGFMKTPVLNAITSPLGHIETLWRTGFEQKVADFESAELDAEMRQVMWRKSAKDAMEGGQDVPPQPEIRIEAPVQKRLLTTDSTFEKLHEILSDNPAGVLMVRDELTGWLAGLDKEGREGERGFFLQAWSGDMSYTMDRIGRGSIFVPAVCVSLLGNIQPTRLRHYLTDALRGGATDDGLFQRFQVMVYPDPPAGKWKLVDRSPNADAKAAAERVYSRLTMLPEDNPTRLCFGPEAQDLFYEWWAEIEARVRGESDLAPAMVGHISKYRSLMPSLAALFELADRVAEDINLYDDTRVSLKHAQQAIAFCRYLESHAHRVYSCVVSPEWRAARELARHIKRGDLAESFTTRAIYLKGWSGLDKPEFARGAISILEDAGWLLRRDGSPTPVGGRPSETWLVNPKVKTARQR